MLLDYINKNYRDSDPIFLNELPCSSQSVLRQEMKKLTDEGKLIRLYNGVYYRPYKTILGTNGKMSIDKFIEKKYIYNNKTKVGFVSGLSLFNRYGFTTQVPSVIEITSNMASTKQRKLVVDDYNIIVYKPIIEITTDNINELEFLDLLLNVDKYSEIGGSELKLKLISLSKSKKINFNLIKEYLPLYPDRIYKNIYNGGIMNELV